MAETRDLTRELILDYPGAPHRQRWWQAFEPGDLAVRATRRGGDDLPKRLLRWDEPPSDPDPVQELRVRGPAKNAAALPPWIAGLRNLEYLAAPLHLFKTLSTDSIPPSVRVLEVDGGTGTVTVPKTVVLPGVTFLIAHPGPPGCLKFTPDNFPMLERLSLGLDREQKMLEVVAAYASLRALHLSGVKAGDLFSRIGAQPLAYLGLASGGLASLSGLGALRNLKCLALKNLPKLQRLSGLESATQLEELSIGYCNGLTSVEELLALPKLRRLSFFGVKKVGVDAIREALENKGLESLSFAGAT